ncbi:hypothetical protein G6011_08784 [Alternaria panax]|uniref:Uncharacterized protein n=1 Tax=Alternaria panax TaxID=48097 RepID=A0AAD4FLC8_9PLEO|nr:hypothetical protein G6011_08784 [Alternaria panax]
MEFERTEPALRAPGNMSPPAKQLSPARLKKTIAAAAVFKKRNNEIYKGKIAAQTNPSNLEFTGEDAHATTFLSAKLHSSSRIAEKKQAKRRSSNMHALGVAFIDASDEYRRHLYDTASLKINRTLESLLHNLYESTLQTITPDSSQQDPNASPLKLSAPANEGKSMRFVQTLETRMLHYDELIAKETTKLGKLQKVWEVVVGEIWKLGATCLGSKAMEEMLFTEQRLNEPSLPLSSSTSKAAGVESTLFVSEHGSSSPCDKSRVGKKRVTFREEEVASGSGDMKGATPTTQFPNFIYQPSRYRKDTLHPTPSLSGSEMKELDKMIKELGRQETDELRRIEKDHQTYWKKKTAQLARALKSD